MGFENIDATPPYERGETVSRPKMSLRDRVFEIDSMIEKMKRKTLLFSSSIIYGITAVTTFLMVAIDHVIQSTGFFNFIWQLIKGLVLGLFEGILWPIFLVFYMNEFWAIWFPVIGSFLFVYKLLFEHKEYRNYFSGIVFVYGMLLISFLIMYFKG